LTPHGVLPRVANEKTGMSSLANKGRSTVDEYHAMAVRSFLLRTNALSCCKG